MDSCGTPLNWPVKFRMCLSFRRQALVLGAIDSIFGLVVCVVACECPACQNLNLRITRVCVCV